MILSGLVSPGSTPLDGINDGVELGLEDFMSIEDAIFDAAVISYCNEDILFELSHGVLFKLLSNG